MTQRTLAILLLVPLTLVTVWSLSEVGLIGIVLSHREPGAAQVFADLVVALLLLLTFLVPHARARGRNPWGWVLATLLLGSFSPLVYLITCSDASHTSAEG